MLQNKEYKFKKIIKNGFSFIEVVIAILLLLLGVLFIGSLFPASFRNMVRSQQTSIATNLAQSKLEEYAEKCMNNPNSVIIPAGGTFPDYPDYNYEVTKEAVSWAGALKQLKVKVYRLVDNKPVIDAVLSQLVPGTKDKYRIYWTSSAPTYLYPAISWDNYLLSITMPALEPGTYIISTDGTLSSYTNEANPVLKNFIYADRNILLHQQDIAVAYQKVGNQVYYNPHMQIAVHLEGGSHTIRWLAKGPTVCMLQDTVVCGGVIMIIEYIPDSLGEFKSN